MNGVVVEKREESVKCMDGCHIASISREDYLRILQKFEAKARDEALDFLVNLPYFSNWSKAMLLKVLSCFKPLK